MDGAKSITAEFEKELEEEVTFKIDEGEAEIASLTAPKSAVTPSGRQLVERMLLYSYWIPIQATLPSTLAPTSNPLRMPAKITLTS